MSKINFNFEIRSQEVERALAELPSDQKKREALGSIGRAIVSRILMGFKTGTDPWGVPWRPLVLRQGKPLLDTGDLRRSIQFQVEDDRVKIGTKKDVTYRGKTHSLGNILQFGRVIKPIPPNTFLKVPVGGSKAGRRPTGYRALRQATIPPRPFLPLRPGMQVDLPPEWARSALNAISRSLGLQ